MPKTSAGIGTAADRQQRRAKALVEAGGRAVYVRLRKPAVDALALLVTALDCTQEEAINSALERMAERLQPAPKVRSWRD